MIKKHKTTFFPDYYTYKTHAQSNKMLNVSFKTF